jgi:hypothetical protein
MDELPGLPVKVPQEYREQLIKFQNQIKILVNNHQVSLPNIFMFIKRRFRGSQYSKIFEADFFRADTKY